MNSSATLLPAALPFRAACVWIVLMASAFKHPTEEERCLLHNVCCSADGCDATRSYHSSKGTAKGEFQVKFSCSLADTQMQANIDELISVPTGSKSVFLSRYTVCQWSCAILVHPAATAAAARRSPTSA